MSFGWSAAEPLVLAQWLWPARGGGQGERESAQGPWSWGLESDTGLQILALPSAHESGQATQLLCVCLLCEAGQREQDSPWSSVTAQKRAQQS